MYAAVELEQAGGLAIFYIDDFGEDSSSTGSDYEGMEELSLEDLSRMHS